MHGRRVSHQGGDGVRKRLPADAELVASASAREEASFLISIEDLAARAKAALSQDDCGGWEG